MAGFSFGAYKKADLFEFGLNPAEGRRRTIIYNLYIYVYSNPDLIFWTKKLSQTFDSSRQLLDL